MRGIVLENRICPRCGSYISYVERRNKNGNIYFYAVHRWRGKEGRNHTRKCYLGKDLEAKFLPVNLYLSQLDLKVIREFFVSRKRIPRWKKERAKELFDKIFNSDRDVVVRKL
jgi:ribosomal protein S27AE